MARYPSETYTSCDQNGAIIPAATVTVTLAGTSTPAKVYAAASGGVSVSSFVSNAVNGSFQFWIDTGDYVTQQLFDLCITKSIYPHLSYSPAYMYNIFIPAWAASGASTRDLGVLATRPSTAGWGSEHSGYHWFNLATGNEELWNGSAVVLMG
jgi:hypothetical protein